MAWHQIELPPGRGSAGCRACGEVFSCVSAFDQHQTHEDPETQEYKTICHEPSVRGLELHEREDKDDPGNPWMVWGWPKAATHWTDDLQPVG